MTRAIRLEARAAGVVSCHQCGADYLNCTYVHTGGMKSDNTRPGLPDPRKPRKSSANQEPAGSATPLLLVLLVVVFGVAINPRVGARPGGGAWLYSCNFNFGLAIGPGGLSTYRPVGRPGTIAFQVPRRRFGC